MPPRHLRQNATRRKRRHHATATTPSSNIYNAHIEYFAGLFHPPMPSFDRWLEKRLFWRWSGIGTARPPACRHRRWFPSSAGQGTPATAQPFVHLPPRLVFAMSPSHAAAGWRNFSPHTRRHTPRLYQILAMPPPQAAPLMPGIRLQGRSPRSFKNNGSSGETSPTHTRNVACFVTPTPRQQARHHCLRLPS